MQLPGLLLLALPLLGSGTRIDVGVAPTLQLKGGQLPVAQGGFSQPGVEGTLTVRAGLQTSSRRTTAQLIYTPRLYLRKPNVIDLDRPLLFQTIQGTYSSAVTRRLGLRLRGSAAAGELNYNDLDAAFDPGTGTINQQVIPLMRLNASGSVSYAESERLSTAFQLTIGHRQPLDSTDTSGVQMSTNMNAAVSQTVRLTPGQSLSAGFSFVRIASTSRDTAAIAANVSYAYAISSLSNLALSAAANYSIQTGAARSANVFPSGTVSHSTNWQGGYARWSMATTGGVNLFFDELSADYQPRFISSWTLSRQSQTQSRWQGGLTAKLSFPIVAPPMPTNRLETQLTLGAPFSLSLGGNARLNFGALFRLRGPHPAYITAEDLQTELAAYVGLSHAFGTGSTAGSWL